MDARSKTFLEKLLLRLKSGDARSIHLNALPGNFARLDVYDLINIDPSLHLRFLNTLLTKEEFSFPIFIDPRAFTGKDEEIKKIVQRTVKKLNHIYYQEKDELAEHGYTSFAFGYPLLIKRDPNNPERILKAPVFIWYLNIEKDLHHNNTWIITRKEDQPVIFNEALKTHLESVEKIRTEAIEQAIDDVFLDESLLLENCNTLSEQLHIPAYLHPGIATILPCTNKESIENLTKEHPWIRFSGIFGLYKTQKQTIIKDLEQLYAKEDVFPAEVNYLNDIEDFSPVELDPSQEHIIHALKSQAQIIIQGPPGTGKSQSLTGIITTALLNNKKVLVVCEKRTALEVLYNNLSGLGLQDLAVLIEDVYAGRKAVVNRVRSKLENMDTSTKRLRQIEYEETKVRFLSLREEINHRLNFSKNIYFGDDNWHEMIVQAVELNEKKTTAEPAAQLPKYLINSNYLFTYDEYAVLRKELLHAESLFQQLEAQAEVYAVLTDDYLNLYGPEEIKHHFSALKEKLDGLYGSLQKNSNQKTYSRLRGAGKYFDKFLSLFSSSRKKLLQQQLTDQQTIKQIQDFLSANLFLSFDVLHDIPKNSMQDAVPGTEKLKELLNHFTTRVSTFDRYYNWRKYLSEKPAIVRQLAEALKQLQAADWHTVLKTWYFNEYIRKTALENGLSKPAASFYENLKQADSGFKQQLPAKILHQWESLQGTALSQRDEAQLKYLYNQRKNKQYETRNSLRKIIHADFDFFSTFFPVVLVNPVVCTSVLPLEAGLFDVILLDEASQLKIEETYSSLHRGKTRIVSGDKQQMPPSGLFGNTVLFYQEEEEENELDNFLAESNSLLDYANDAGYPNHYLDFHYRSQHPALINFSNAAFYNSRLIPMPEKENYVPLRFNQVNGVYTNHTNEEEAQRVVDHIYSIERALTGWPSIGVATFNLFQRDLILDMLWEQAYADTEKLAKLEALFQQGLFVKNLENIQGDERDIMILSTTFGPDENGKFRQFFGPLTQEKGYQLLNVIVTRAKESLYVYCSVPENVFLSFREELQQKGNTGKAIFYAYLSYAKAVSENNPEQQRTLLEILSKNSAEKKNSPVTKNYSLFKQHVFDHLYKEFGEKVKQNERLGGFLIAVAVTGKNGIKLAIDLDESPSYLAEVAYRHKIQREKILHNYGIDTFHIWSYEWWQDPAACIRRIKEAI